MCYFTYLSYSVPVLSFRSFDSKNDILRLYIKFRKQKSLKKKCDCAKNWWLLIKNVLVGNFLCSKRIWRLRGVNKLSTFWHVLKILFLEMLNISLGVAYSRSSLTTELFLLTPYLSFTMRCHILLIILLYSRLASNIPNILCIIWHTVSITVYPYVVLCTWSLYSFWEYLLCYLKQVERYS